MENLTYREGVSGEYRARLKELGFDLDNHGFVICLFDSAGDSRFDTYHDSYKTYQVQPQYSNSLYNFVYFPEHKVGLCFSIHYGFTARDPVWASFSSAGFGKNGEMTDIFYASSKGAGNLIGDHFGLAGRYSLNIDKSDISEPKKLLRDLLLPENGVHEGVAAELINRLKSVVLDLFVRAGDLSEQEAAKAGLDRSLIPNARSSSFEFSPLPPPPSAVGEVKNSKHKLPFDDEPVRPYIPGRG